MSQLSQMDSPPRQEPERRRWKEMAAVLAGLGLAVILGIAAWLVLRDDATPGAVGATATFGPAIVDEATLRTESARVGHTVYWMPPDGRVMELTILDDSTVHVKYLPAGATQAAATPGTTVSSWPMADPLGHAEQSARSDGSMSQQAAGGGLVVTGSDSAYNAYIAQPDTTALGEVFDPEAGRAWRDVTKGKVTILQP